MIDQEARAALTRAETALAVAQLDFDAQLQATFPRGMRVRYRQAYRHKQLTPGTIEGIYKGRLRISRNHRSDHVDYVDWTDVHVEYESAGEEEAA